eukprot:gene17612-17816_t
MGSGGWSRGARRRR